MFPPCFFFSLSTYERIVLSKEKVENFIKDNFPEYKIKSVAGDGLCILKAFQEALMSNEENVTLDDIILQLKKEIQEKEDFYRSFSPGSIDINDELDKYLKDPLIHYSGDTVDLFLVALGNAYEANIIVFQSNFEYAWITDLSNHANGYKKTLHFARTESLHIDPVVRKGEKLV